MERPRECFCIHGDDLVVEVPLWDRPCIIFVNMLTCKAKRATLC